MNRKSQRGLAAIEYIVVLLMLIPMVIGTVELGRYIYQYNTLTKAVRDGARYAGDNALSSSGILTLTGTLISETQNLVAYGNTNTALGTAVLQGINSADVSVTAIDVTGMSAGTISPSHVRVTADYTFTPLFDIIPAGSITMTASTVQRAI